MHISRHEKWLVIIVFGLLWVAFALLAGGPIFSDEMMYIDLGLRNIAEPSYGNRYFHIYLQKLFISIFPTPLAGIRVFWGFLISLTTALVYLNARELTRKSTVLHGLLAVAFFFSFPLLREYSGEPAVDITAMAMIILYLTIYLWGVKNPEKQKQVLFILGTLAFLCLKTKETTIFINVLLFGYFKERIKAKPTLKDLVNMIRPFLYGIAAGIGIFIVLDTNFLGKPFFAISPSTFNAIFTHYDFGQVFFNGPSSWYTVYLLDELFLPFLFFLLSGMKLQRTAEDNIRIIWIYPLLFIAFLSWNMFKIPWGFIERFYFPALPVIAILAPQVLRFKWPQKKRDWIWFIGSVVLSAVFILIMRSFWLEIARKYSFEYTRLLDAVYYPILISILLAALIWEKRTGWKHTIVQLFCIGALLFSPLLMNYKYFVTFPKIKEHYETVFYPFEIFKNKLEIAGDDWLYVSADLKTSQDMLSKDPNDITGMYNFFFDARISRENVFLGYGQKELSADLMNREFSHALLSEDDVRQLKDNELWGSVNEKIDTVYSDKSKTVYLLIF